MFSRGAALCLAPVWAEGGLRTPRAPEWSRAWNRKTSEEGSARWMRLDVSLRDLPCQGMRGTTTALTPEATYPHQAQGQPGLPKQTVSICHALQLGRRQASRGQKCRGQS